MPTIMNEGAGKIAIVPLQTGLGDSLREMVVLLLKEETGTRAEASISTESMRSTNVEGIERMPEPPGHQVCSSALLGTASASPGIGTKGRIVRRDDGQISRDVDGGCLTECQQV